jgi:hypothetical protein
MLSNQFQNKHDCLVCIDKETWWGTILHGSLDSVHLVGRDTDHLCSGLSFKNVRVPATWRDRDNLYIQSKGQNAYCCYVKLRLPSSSSSSVAQLPVSTGLTWLSSHHLAGTGGAGELANAGILAAAMAVSKKLFLISDPRTLCLLSYLLSCGLLPCELSVGSNLSSFTVFNC